MDIIGSLLSGAVGYGISEASKSHPLRDLIDQKINAHTANKDLRDVINSYAKANGIYGGRNNRFAYLLHQIASEWEEYNYSDIY